MNESDAGNKRDGPLHLGKPLLECCNAGSDRNRLCIKVVELD